MRKSISAPSIMRVGRISNGTYGIVYRAECNFLEDLCALKETRYAHLSEELVNFEREAEIIMSCDHPNIIRGFYSSFVNQSEKLIKTMDNIPFYLMELCYEHPLGHIIHKKIKSYTLKQKLDILCQISDGMIYLHHKMKIVHRDLKLDNILIGFDGKIRIADFGFSNWTKYLQRQFNFGTAEYLAPEIPFANDQTFDVTKFTLCDIYSFGIMIWELMTEKMPFRDQNVNGWGLAVKVAKKDLRPNLRELTEILPTSIKNIIKSLTASCWNKDPTMRPKNFCEILTKLNLSKCILENKILKKKSLPRRKSKTFKKRRRHSF